MTSWEPLNADRVLVTSKSDMRVQDTYGFLMATPTTDMPQIDLPVSASDAAAGQDNKYESFAEYLKRLKDVPLPERFKGRKLIIVSYNLPVILRQERVPVPQSSPSASPTYTTKWTASWSPDEFIARSSENSIADDIETIWVGCVTGQCIDRGAGIDKTRRMSMESAGSARSDGTTDGPATDSPHDSMDSAVPNTSPLSSPPSGTRSAMPFGSPAFDPSRFASLSEEDQAQIREVLRPMKAYPLFVPLAVQDKFGKYCLNVLGPALNNVLETSTRSEFSLEKLNKGFAAYKLMNRLIAEGVATEFKERDVVWIHGYELIMFANELATLVTRPRQVCVCEFGDSAVRVSLLIGLLCC